MLVKAACEILNTDTDVRAILGRNKVDTKYKCYAGIVPQPERYPYSCVRLTSKIPVLCRGTRSTTFNAGFAVYCYHKNYEDVVNLASAVQEALDNKTGTYGGVNFKPITYGEMQDGDYNREFGVHCRIVFFNCFIDENPAT